MIRSWSARIGAATLAALSVCTRVAGAQSASGSVGAQAVLVYDRVSPVPGGGALGELRVVQPAVMAHASLLGDRLRFVGMVDLEGATMPDGQLAPGAFGEGFVDRRHPHTYAHELIVSGLLPFAGTAGGASLSVGKGFAPFGTDDPMSRPVLRYPVNHHFAQLLERAVAIAALRYRGLMMEGALFNGDEPEEPSQWPRLSRFGDSWSLRATARAALGVEVQGSFAHVASPEHREGAGSTQRKWSASARFERRFRETRAFAMAEWARTSESDGMFVFTSLLAEAGWAPGRHSAYYRFERTERPEEERTLDRFRSVRPHHDNSVFGRSRWTMHTAGIATELAWDALPVRIGPILEFTVGRVTSLTPASFDPETFYGRSTFWSLSAGVRVGWGARLHRMGRYGVAAEDGVTGAHSHRMVTEDDT